MRPIGFDKKAYKTRATILAILVVACAAYWYEWLVRGERLLIAIGTALAIALIIVLSSYRRLLVILVLEVLGGLAVLGTIRYGVTGKSIVPGVAVVVGISLLLYLLGAHRRGTKRVLENEGLGKDTGSLELNIEPVRRQTKSDEP